MNMFTKGICTRVGSQEPVSVQNQFQLAWSIDIICQDKFLPKGDQYRYFDFAFMLSDFPIDCLHPHALQNNDVTILRQASSAYDNKGVEGCHRAEIK